MGYNSGMSDQITQGQLIPAKNGVLRDAVTGRIVANPGATSNITRENASALQRRRQEKTAHMIRQGLIKASGSASAYEAIALGAEHLYRGVLDPTEDLEKRRKAWLSVGKQAELLSEGVQTSDKTGSSVTLAGGDVSKLLDVISQVISSRQDTR